LITNCASLARIFALSSSRIVRSAVENFASEPAVVFVVVVGSEVVVVSALEEAIGPFSLPVVLLLVPRDWPEEAEEAEGAMDTGSRRLCPIKNGVTDADE
jgi:hypothetical protein